ncbi:MAG: electron transfer flavoprotein subunit beta/FixA family protein [Gracilibacteraceae bacterium]|jgi:electron transfer flavoprotein beta subunit|nr:electron transfer flavoprotein subunit beta/FixA family protein [Gracilibacteraceae bacterium]
MKIITCYKWALDEEDIIIDKQSREVITGRAKYRISPYDRNALECGVRFAEANGGEIVALTVGGPETAGSTKDVLSRGANRAVYIACPELAAADSAATSRALAAAVNKIGDFDLIICGEGSSDNYAQQTGPRLAELLGVPVVSYVSKAEIEGNMLRAERKLEDGMEAVETPLPALITVLPDINEARIPSLKQILAAGRKPVDPFTIEDLNLPADMIKPLSARLSTQGAVTDRRCVVLQGDGAAIELVGILKSEGIC